MVDLPDRGVHRHQQPLPTPQLRHVAQQHQGAVDLAPQEQGDDPGQDGDVARPLDLLDHGHLERHQGLNRLGPEPQILEPATGDRAPEPEAVEGRHGIGRRVHDPGVAIEHQRTVADPGGDLGDRVLEGKGEDPLADHLSQPLEDVQVGQLQITEGAVPDPGCLPRHHRDHPILMAHGNGQHLGSGGRRRQLDLALDDDLVPVGPAHHRPLLHRHEAADLVVAVHRLGRRRPDLAQAHELAPLALTDRGEQEHVGEA